MSATHLDPPADCGDGCTDCLAAATTEVDETWYCDECAVDAGKRIESARWERVNGDDDNAIDDDDDRATIPSPPWMVAV